MTLAWAVQIYRFSTEAFSSILTTWLLRQLLGLLHLTVSSQAFNFLHHLMRKGAHATEYALLSMLLYFSVAGVARLEWRKRPALWSFLIAAVYSLTDEFHQRFVPGRGPSFLDSGIDTLGALLGILLIFVADRIFENKPGVAAPGQKAER